MLSLTVFAVSYFKLGVIIPKRLHDINDSGWWAVMFLVPIFNLAFDLYLLFKPGTRQANRYGPVSRSWPWEKLSRDTPDRRRGYV